MSEGRTSEGRMSEGRTSEGIAFSPPRRRGLMFHITLAIALGSICGFSLFYAMGQQVGAYFALLMLIALIAFAPLPFVVYRAYALGRASYRIERDGLRLRWGMRAEDIPLPEVEWVRNSSDLATDLRLPRFSVPGAILGRVNMPDLGPVEFLSSSGQNMLLIATRQCIYAISPDDPESFLRAFQQAFEMGSLSPIAPVSQLPAAYLSSIWNDGAARILLLSGFLLALLLFIGVSLAIPTQATFSLGFASDGTPLPAGPAAQALLLPTLCALIYLGNLAAGLFFYRRPETRLVGYIVWGSGVLTGLLFVTAALVNLT
jgi:hypothetical protein